MAAALVVLVIVAAVISRPVAVRLWLAGVISDRTLFVASVVRFPAVVLAFGLILRLPIPVLVMITLLSLVPGLLFSRVVHEQIQRRPTRRCGPSRRTRRSTRGRSSAAGRTTGGSIP